MTKRDIRREMKLRAAAAAEWNSDGLADELWNRVESLPEFAASRTVLVYMSLPDEVPSREFIYKWLGAKRIALPLVCGERLAIKELRLIGDSTGERRLNVHPGYRGIDEPDAGAPDIAPDEVDLALVPGVAFDRSRNRLGRGKGFYDRLLPDLKCPKLGVAQGWRIVEKLPTDSWDASLDLIITDGEII